MDEVTTLVCPRCNFHKFLVEFPEVNKEPRWVVVCQNCDRKYLLGPDGVIYAL